MANKPNIGGKIVLEGESEYRKALSEITAGLKVNYSQMALVSQQYAKTADSEDALRAKSEALESAIASQTEKVELMKSRLQQSIDTLGEGSTKTMAYQTATNRAEAQLVKLQQELGDTNSALKKTTKSTDDAAGAMNTMQPSTMKVSDAVSKVTDALGINLPPAATKAINSMGSMTSSAALATAGVVALVAALGMAIDKMYDMTAEAAANAGDIGTAAQMYSITTEQVQELAYAEEKLEVSNGTITNSLPKLTEKINSGSEAFKELGVKTKDSNGQYRDTLDIFYDVIDKLGKMKNQTEADTYAQQLFGESFAQIKPVILAGSDAIKGYGKTAKDTGLIMTDDMVTALDAVYQKNLDVEDGWDAITNSMAYLFAPAASDVDDMLTDGLQPILKDLGEASIPVLTGVVSILASGFELLEKPLNVVALVLETIILLVEMAVVAFDSLYQGIMMLIGQQDKFDYTNYNAMLKTSQAMEKTWGRVVGSNAKGTEYWTGGPTWVGEDGPEIVELPRGSRIYPNGQAPATGTGGSAVTYYYVTIDAKNVQEFNDVVSIAQNEATTIRQGVSR